MLLEIVNGVEVTFEVAFSGKAAPTVRFMIEVSTGGKVPRI